MYYDRGLLQKMNYKFGKYAIQNLMTIIVGAMAIVFIADFMVPVNLSSMFAFNTAAIMQGEIWRIITFIFIPPDASMIFIIFALYFYWMLSSSLEREWGAFKFNVFYLCGMIGTIAAGLITGHAVNIYLNLSIFLAFAILYPNFQILMFFIIPIKMKWIALINAAFLLFTFLSASWPDRISLLVSLLNIGLFFGKDLAGIVKREYRRIKWNQNFRR